MRIRWEECKRQLVLRKRKIDFADLEVLLCLPYIEDQRSHNPEQYRIVGFAAGRIVTFIVELKEK